MYPFSRFGLTIEMWDSGGEWAGTNKEREIPNLNPKKVYRNKTRAFLYGMVAIHENNEYNNMERKKDSGCVCAVHPKKFKQFKLMCEYVLGWFPNPQKCSYQSIPSSS